MNLLANFFRSHLPTKANLFSPKDQNALHPIFNGNFTTAAIRCACAFNNLNVCAATRHSFYFVSVLLALIFFSAAPIRAAQIVFAWDRNAPAPDGYRLFKRIEGQPYDYANPEWTGNATTCTVTNLTDGVQYYFVVRAYVGADESGDSNEAEYLPSGSNHAPAAQAGDDQIAPGQTIVSLNGLLSTDADDDLLTYAWAQIGGLPVTLSNPSDAQTYFTAPEATDTATTLSFQLTVVDPDGLSSTDTCQVVIEAEQPFNEAPEAEAGPNQIVTYGQTVHLSGSSSDPEDDPLTFQWIQKGGPTVYLSAANVLNPSFSAPNLGNDQSATLIFELMVNDDHAHFAADTCLVQVQHPAPTDADGDSDGVVDTDDAFPEDPNEHLDTDLDGLGNNADLDDDNDGMPDKWELQYGLNPLTDDSDLDADMDGSNNIEEYLNGTDPTQSEHNLAPAQPELLYPWDGATDISTTPKLEASDFIDPDAIDSHVQTQWRITIEQNAKLAMQIKKNSGELTWYQVPKLVLNPNSVYTCQVRYFDQQGNASQWSSPVSFTTEANRTDTNSNGVPDAQDVSVRTDLDLNGIPDLQEPQVMKSVLAFDEQYAMAVDLKTNDDNTTMIDGAAVLDPDAIEELPQKEDISIYGILTFRIKVEEPGQEILTTIFLSGGIDPNMQWLSLNADGNWVNCSDDITLNDDGRSIMRQLKDGGKNDADGVANGTIIHAIGPIVKSDQQQDPINASPEDEAPISDSDTPESSGCFIGSLL